MDKLKRAADYIADGLYNAGCRYAFGMPGGEVLSVLDALKKSGIEFVLCKHENNGGHMAEGVYQRTGKLGVLLVTIGPGATNIVNAVANSYQERVPLIVITGCIDTEAESYYTHQVLDHQKVFAGVTKASFKVSAATIDIVVDKAIKIATTGQPGPVHIDVPVGMADVKVEPSLHNKTALPSAMVPAPTADLLRAQELFANSKKPLLIAGIDSINQNAEEAIEWFVKKYKVPIITTYKSKGVVSEYDPLSLGGAGLSPKADKILLKLLKQADLIIGAGYDPIEMRDNWKDIWDINKVGMIDITATINNHYMHSSTVNFVGDVGASLRSIAEDIKPFVVWADRQPEKTRRELQLAFSPTKEWGPSLVIESIRKLVPKNTIATCDTGAHKILLSQMWKCSQSKTLLQSNSLSTMATALPLAIGAQIAEPKRKVVAFTGDAGLLMCLGELSTVKEMNLPIIFIVFVDYSIALIEKKQRERGFDNAGVDFNYVDFSALAKAFGGDGYDAHNKQQLESSLKSALSNKNFTIISCHLPKFSYDGKF
tara:strand:- start:347 stop:1966 length:1620 start_codon:yes stop_codon:yes gene_type:complete